jgi:tryptophan synthase alpha subunit
MTKISTPQKKSTEKKMHRKHSADVPDFAYYNTLFSYNTRKFLRKIAISGKEIRLKNCSNILAI